MRNFTPEQQKFFRESPHAAGVRRLFDMHRACPGDPGAAALLDCAIDEAMKHPDFPAPAEAG